MDTMFGKFSVTRPKEMVGSGDERATESHHTQGLQQKRPYSVLRDCEAGSGVGYSDGHVNKKIKGADHEGTWNLTKHKATSYGRDLMRQRHGDHSKVVSRPYLHRRSSDMLNLPLSGGGGSGDDDDDEIVRDGPGKEVKKKGTPSLPNQRRTQSEPFGNNNQGEGVSEQSPQFPDYSNPVAHARLMPFMQSNGPQEPSEGDHNSMTAQDWVSNDNVDEHDHCSSSSKQSCIAQPESCSSRSQTPCNSQSDGVDGQYFKSPPAQPQGSNSMQSSECLTWKGSQQEVESNASCFNTLYYPTSLGPDCYYRAEETTQRMESNNVALLEQDPPSLSDHQSEGSIHSEENQPSVQTHSGDMTETDLNQNQLPPTEDP